MTLPKGMIDTICKVVSIQYETDCESNVILPGRMIISHVCRY